MRCKQKEILPTYTTYEDGTDKSVPKRRHILVKREEIFPAYTTCASVRQEATDHVLTDKI